MVSPEVAELVKTVSAGLLALLAIYTAYRLARSKQQIVRVYRDAKSIHVVNAGETTVFLHRCGAVGPWGAPLEFVMRPEIPEAGKIEPGQKVKWALDPHAMDPPGAASAKHVWAELQSGARITSHPSWDLRGLLARARTREAFGWED